MEAACEIREVRLDLTFRHPDQADLADIAELMLDAYRGTIDSSGNETLDDALAETQSYFDGASGQPLRDCSYVAEDNGLPVGATLVSLYDGLPLLAYCFTEPSYTGQGLATTLVRLSMNALVARGYSTLRLVVTVGNTPAERVFEKVGFRPVV